MTHEIDLEKITFFFCLQSTMSLSVSAMSWVMCDDDDDDDDDDVKKTVIYKRTTLSAKATSSL